ncbi:MAG: glycosyltransferase [Alphaproteobacteria bacterium]|nr:glycosyltransferase [Alphaproteobacteria bacterium]
MTDASALQGDIHVSVVISTKNRVGLLADALRGLASQTLDPSRFEVIILDNQSTDDIAGLIEDWRARVKFELRYHRMDVDGGPSPSRNLGARMARGPIVAFTDSDCRPAPGWLENGLAAMAPDIAFATGVVLYKPGQQVQFLSKLSAERTWDHPGFPTANIFYRRDVFLEFGGFDVTLSFRDPFDRAVECADTDLAWRMLEAGRRRTFVPEAIVYHEIETLPLKLWLIEPTRLFVMPLLLRKHPELRRVLLTARLFFFPGTLIIYLGLLLAIAAMAVAPALLWLAVPVIFLRALVGLRPFRLSDFPRRIVETVLNIARVGIMAMTLVYGSLRYRCLVL